MALQSLMCVCDFAFSIAFALVLLTHKYSKHTSIQTFEKRCALKPNLYLQPFNKFFKKIAVILKAPDGVYELPHHFK